MNNKLDKFDLKLLEQIQQNNHLTANQLAENVCLSASAVQRRLRRLRENKIIEREIGIVSADAVGRSLMAIVEVTLGTVKPDIVQHFDKAVRAVPEVMQAYDVTGHADFILIVSAKTMQDYEEFIHEFLSKKLKVKNFRTSIVMRRVKTGFALPLDGAIG